MTSFPYIDLHTHPFRNEPETITIQNIYPGDGFAAFSGRNFYSVGLHPWHIKEHDENNELLFMVEEAMTFDEIIFIGECGLDKKANTDFSEQKRVFEAQAFMAEESQKPLIVHCVKAHNEIIELYDKMQPAMPWILHGYNGNIQITKQYDKRNFLFSFGDSLLKSNTKAIESFKYIDCRKLFFETDEYDGDVSVVYKKAADLKNTSIENLKKEVWHNFHRIENCLMDSL